MVKYTRGDIILIPFPFIKTGHVKRKLHPAIIISNMEISKRYTDINLVPITSKISADVMSIINNALTIELDIKKSVSFLS